MDEGGGDEGDGGDPASPPGLQIASSVGFFVSLPRVWLMMFVSQFQRNSLGTRRTQPPSTAVKQEKGDGEDGEKCEQDVDDVDRQARRLEPPLTKLGGVHTGQVVGWSPGS